MLDSLIEQSFSGTEPVVALVRLVSAVILGGVIGFERSMNARTAGLRTHILVSLASCLFALLSAEILARFHGEVADPLRLIEAVTSGVAFLAAGSIIVSGGRLMGLTTGAGMWLAGAIGLACGIGALALALMATLIVVPVLWVLQGLSHRIESTRRGEAPLPPSGYHRT
ncbi:MAG: MgtC/SapB family protein [Pararhodobacter sp.]|nr:MgtC/SapB family protein [Pararhodobacter sp.]